MSALSEKKPFTSGKKYITIPKEQEKCNWMLVIDYKLKLVWVVTQRENNETHVVHVTCPPGSVILRFFISLLSLDKVIVVGASIHSYIYTHIYINELTHSKRVSWSKSQLGPLSWVCMFFIPPSKNIHVRLIGDSKLTLGVSVSAWGYLSRLSLCGLVMDCWPIQGVSCLSSSDSWDQLDGWMDMYGWMDGWFSNSLYLLVE